MQALNITCLLRSTALLFFFFSLLLQTYAWFHTKQITPHNNHSLALKEQVEECLYEPEKVTKSNENIYLPKWLLNHQF